MLKEQRWHELWWYEADDIPDGLQFCLCCCDVINESFIAIITINKHRNQFC